MRIHSGLKSTVCSFANAHKTQVLTGLFSVTYRPLDTSSESYKQFKKDLAKAADELSGGPAQQAPEHPSVIISHNF